MANLTIAIDEDLLRRARVRAVQQGTSVNAVLREYLATYVGVDEDVRRALADLRALSRSSRAGRGKKSWTRDELHDR